MAVWVILSYISYVSGSLGHYLLPARREGGENARRDSPPPIEQDATDRMLDGRSGDRRPPTTRLAYGPPRRLARGAASLGTAPPRAAPPYQGLQMRLVGA